MLKLLQIRIKKLILWKWLPRYCHNSNCRYCWCNDMGCCDELKLTYDNVKHLLKYKWVYGECRHLCGRCKYRVYCLEEYRKE